MKQFHPHHSPAKGSPRRRRGASLGQFLLAAAVLTLALLAAFEFCRVAMLDSIADNAVYAGCRTAVAPGGTSAAARSATEKVLETLRVSHAEVKVVPAVITPATTEVTVIVEINVDRSTIVPAQFTGAQFTGGEVIRRRLTLPREVPG